MMMRDRKKDADGGKSAGGLGKSGADLAFLSLCLDSQLILEKHNADSFKQRREDAVPTTTNIISPLEKLRVFGVDTNGPRY